MGRPKLIKVDVRDGRGRGGHKLKTLSVRRCIPDILAFRDTPGFAYLLLAANPEMSVSVLRMVLEAVGPHQEHPATWMHKRRDLFRVPAMPDYADPRAVVFIGAHMGEPSWKLSKQLRGRGIKCSAQQVHRIWMAIRHLNVKK